MEDIKQLIKDLFHWNWGVSESARTKLLQLGEQVVPDLIDALWLYQERVTPAIIQGIIILIGKSAVDDLIPWLYKRSLFRHDKDNFMSKKAAEILGEIGNVRAVLPLIQNLDSPEDLRYLVAKALEKILEKQEAREYIRANRESIIELYGDSFMRGIREDNSPEFIRVVISILSEIGALAVPRLMKSPNVYTITNAIGIIPNGLLVLGEMIRNCKSIEELDQIRVHIRDFAEKNDDPDIRKVAISFLQLINERKNELLRLDIKLDSRIRPPQNKGGESYRVRRVLAVM